MKKRYLAGGMLAALGTLHGCGGSDDPGPSVQEPSDPPRLACAKITAAALGIPRLELDAPETVAAAAADNPAQSVPAHCRLKGRLNLRNSDVDGKTYAIGFELRMPDTWNGRFFFQGGGGTDGAVNPALGALTGAGASTNALSMGFAVASTDGGHTSESEPIVGGSLFGLDPQARVDYGYNAVGTVTPTAKAILKRFYGRGAEHSYFVGCSNGGRQAMVAASRFADQFDGIVAGNPGFNLPQAAVQHAWDNQAFAAAAPRTGEGRPIISQAFSFQDMQLVADRTVAACDALDGAADGMIDDPVACKAVFKPETLTCAGAKTDACLSAPQVDALKKVFGGPKNSKGEALYADWPYDAGVATMGWRFWKLGTSTTEVPNSLIATLGGGSLPYVFTTPPTQVRGTGTQVIDYLLGFDFDTDAPKIFATTPVYTESPMSFMTPPDPTNLGTLKARGGKMIVYHGNSDPVFSVNDTIAWYQGLRRAHADAPDFARLFTIPGMNHCSGGPATDKFDMVAAIVDWVEKGVAPASIPASARASSDAPWPGRTRPLCPYPQQARYTGSGSLEDAKNFRCTTPAS
ncbi:tannase/feruloyl esterase family alpha/beta hydrolase [Pigmentiphaga sp. GD03639]|uniref:tannase/feruloyl esterase family alpha/beta hydrolase n=1 Tax=Pigmentiphaga sp. GD03639 TaxID=2975354 RepID=UPI002446DBC4|nr:tannase/feruloyl esterase family alpha/beta hydrolase [Pigmentiphaga sp. GD03639]MDH2239529.1 tannase/feruloyl esterase family alpha/beta hydrolase [Pigmentiphaga sp. GD03639]